MCDRCVLEVEDMEDKLSSFEDIYDKREQVSCSVDTLLSSQNT